MMATPGRRTFALMRHLAANDARLIGRDPLLIFSGLYLVVIALALRWGVPPLGRWLLAEHGFDLVVYHPLVVAYVSVLLGSLFIGLMIGFVVLDEKEDGTLRALLVTPMPLNTYLLYRVSVPVALAAAATPALIWLMDLGSPPWATVWLIALVSAPLGAIGTLFFPVFADDKVQAFAYAKLLSGLCFLPIVAYFVAEPWRDLAVIFPPYFIVKAFWEVMEGDPRWPGHLAVGALLTWGALGWMVHRFRRVVYGQ